ncbi:MAG: Ig-like domain-containing protein, partial [Deltaproteobacteria bacterium]|nr:Ig-like domain-containing protein [Deltaproteobacteria bacterium]
MATIELPALYIDTVFAPANSTRPVLINRNPAPDETNVPLHSVIALEIVDTENSGISRDSTQVWVDEVPAFEGGAAEEIKAAFSGTRALVVESGDTLQIVLDPLSPFVSESKVAVRVVATTNDGDALDETYTFVAEDKTQPKVVAAQAASPKTIRLGFDEYIQVVDAAGFVITPIEFPAVAPFVTDAISNGQLVELRLNTEMTPTVDYEITITGVTDLVGNDIDPFFATARFKGFIPTAPAARQFDLWTMLPVWNRREDVTGDLQNFVSCLQEVLNWLLADV